MIRLAVLVMMLCASLVPAVLLLPEIAGAHGSGDPDKENTASAVVLGVCWGLSLGFAFWWW